MIDQPDSEGQERRLDVDDAQMSGLRSLAVPAPADTFSRFRRRAAVVQGTRMLFESQVIGFWVVLDALLRMLLGARPANGTSAGQGAATQVSLNKFPDNTFHGEQA